jgi:hypothetical protein
MQGTSREYSSQEERSYVCRTCKLTARGRWVPAGWYVLNRSAGGGAGHLRLGLYCRAACLAAAEQHLAEGERAVQRPGLPADTLRHWLREAGVQVGPTGTLTGERPATAVTPPRPRPVPVDGRNPVTVLNELSQAGTITTPVWQVEQSGPTHAPTFTTTVTTTCGDVALTGQGQAPAKGASRNDAAAQLVDALRGLIPTP